MLSKLVDPNDPAKGSRYFIRATSKHSRPVDMSSEQPDYEKWQKLDEIDRENGTSIILGCVIVIFEVE